MQARPRRSTRALAVAAVCAAFPLTVAAPATAAPTTDPALVGLYGVQDPTNPQAVFRQSLALLGLVAAGRTPDPSAIGWLEGQQCPDGSFMGYAIDDACTPQGFDQPESNSTALASIALRVVDSTAAADDALDWLATVQTATGGFGFLPGVPADANSTGLAINAILAANADPATWNGKDAYAGLGELQADCLAPEPADRGAFTLEFPPGTFFADAFATAGALTAAAGSSFPVPAADPATWADDAVLDCSNPGGVKPGGDPVAAAAWLVATGADALAGSFDSVSVRAFSVLGLAAAEVGEDLARELWDDLQADATTALVNGGSDSPGPLGLYLMAGVALGADASLINGYADRLEATLTTATATPSPTPSPTPTPQAPTTTPSAPANSTATMSASSVVPGGSLTVSGAGFAAGERVDVFVLSTPTQVGSTTANAQGVASLTFQVPRTLDPGAHTVELRGASGRVVSAGFTVTAPASASGARLAASGPAGDTLPLALGGLGLLLVGGALVTVGRAAGRTAAR
jgi:hypothetical protein